MRMPPPSPHQAQQQGQPMPQPSSQAQSPMSQPATPSSQGQPVGPSTTPPQQKMGPGAGPPNTSMQAMMTMQQRQNRIAPVAKPVGLDPIELLNERENRYTTCIP